MPNSIPLVKVKTNFSNCFPYGTANNPERATETVLNLSLTQDFI